MFTIVYNNGIFDKKSGVIVNSLSISDDEFIDGLGEKVAKYLSNKAVIAYYKALDNDEIRFGLDHYRGTPKRIFMPWQKHPE